MKINDMNRRRGGNNKNLSRGPGFRSTNTNINSTQASSLEPSTSSYMDDVDEPDEMEVEVMGDLKGFENRKSKIMQRNFEQMVDVLHMRLSGLEDAAKLRLELCKEDVKANSKKMSTYAPRLMEDIEDVNPRGLKDKAILSGIKDNLITTDGPYSGVYVDPVRLIIRTKQATETGRKLEAKLEESFGMSNMRDMKGKGKTKSSNRAARSKKSEARKYKAKKEKRQGIEEILRANMESYLMRSVADEEMKFRLPYHSESLPIPVKWSPKDPRFAGHENTIEGGMDPYLLLQYGLERVTLPSGEGVFRKLIRQPTVHSYFVHSFWFIKVRFFQRDSGYAAEKHLLSILGEEYVTIMELLSRLLPAEHEKDFIFKYFPYIIANAVFYAFYFLCPNSRHLYTKSFRKNIVLQLFQILFGIQLCPISLKVNWAKLFPEEAQDEDEGEDKDKEGDSFQTSHGHGGMGMGNTTNNVSFGTDFGMMTGESKPGTRLSGTRPESSRDGKRISGRYPSDAYMMSSTGVGLLETDGEGPQRLALGGTGDVRLGTSKSDSSVLGRLYTSAISRTNLKPPAARPKRIAVAPRQQKETIDTSDISPLVQEFLHSETSSGGKRQQLFRRTVPVNWCLTGGSDTHHRKIIPKELHDELSQRAREAKRTLLTINTSAQKTEIKALRKVLNNREKVLAGGAASIGKLSLDLVKRRKNPRGLMDRDMDGGGGSMYQGDQSLNDDDDDDTDNLLL